ncbi:MAG: winged helix DNA-binding domain-containing protein, partial [Gammaproteobacteria bacterium]|nr:winged helix DNA-binding domain-containing protein [Gammaproteobacteria bacterium]
AYDMAKLDAKTFQPRHRELFEYWGHEASLLPFRMHPLFRWRMARAERLEGVYREIAKLVQERRSFVDDVLMQIAQRGPLSARDLNSGSGGGGYWEWHDDKTALEYLFWAGHVTAVTRRGFERVYDLSERVLPGEVIGLPTPTEEDAQRELIRISSRALGVATESDLRDYFRLRAADAKSRVTELTESGDLLPVRVEGWRQQAYLNPDAHMPRHVRGSALLSPFDPLIWERARTERLFNFRYRLEIYTPKSKRQYGYYVLPFLHDEQLAARVDLKADRAGSILLVLAAYGESEIEDQPVVAALACELQRLACWLGLEHIAIHRRDNLGNLLNQRISMLDMHS